jgi:hypothetical protein
MAVGILRDVLADWTEFDMAGFQLGKILGVFPEDWRFGRVKGMFWTADPLGEMLVDVLDRMAETGVLLKNEDLQFRWNTDETNILLG